MINKMIKFKFYVDEKVKIRKFSGREGQVIEIKIGKYNVKYLIEYLDIHKNVRIKYFNGDELYVTKGE